MSNKLKIVSNNSKLILIILGLICILLGNGFNYEILKIDIDSLIVNLGALFLVIGTLQWIFDEGMRKEIAQEISYATLGTDRMFRNGIRDCTNDSKKINEENIWKSTDELIIGVHYSNRFFSDYSEIVKDRIKNNKTTYLFHIEEKSIAAKYLRSSHSGNSNIGQKTKNLLALLESEFDSTPLIKIIQHNRILRYSFIKTDQTIWIRFFTNSEGFALVPAIKVEISFPFFDFFSNDIQKLKEQSQILDLYTNNYTKTK